MSVKTEPI